MLFADAGEGKNPETDAKVTKTKKLAKRGQRRELCHSKVPSPRFEVKVIVMFMYMNIINNHMY